MRYLCDELWYHGWYLSMKGGYPLPHHKKDPSHTEHTHDTQCGCGCEHQHPHHDHGEHCACGHEHRAVQAVDGLTHVQQSVLLALHERRCLPVACFSLAKQGDAHGYAIALAPVYLGSPQDTMEMVKELGAQLTQLEEGGLITLDYDIRLSGYPYAEYETSELYAYFKRTVAEGKSLQNARYDTANLELGSMALTEEGHAMIAKMMQ